MGKISLSGVAVAVKDDWEVITAPASAAVQLIRETSATVSVKVVRSAGGQSSGHRLYQVFAIERLAWLGIRDASCVLGGADWSLKRSVPGH